MCTDNVKNYALVDACVLFNDCLPILWEEPIVVTLFIILINSIYKLYYDLFYIQRFLLPVVNLWNV